MPKSVGKRETEGCDSAFDELAVGHWQTALRFAQLSEEAPLRCQRRACRVEGRCHMTFRSGEPLDCGGGVSDVAIEKAALAVLFSCGVLCR